MDSLQDAFGHALYDYMVGQSVSDVIEREDGYITVTPGPVTYFAEYEDWYPVEKEAIKQAFGRVLDIGCGAGRHALYLQEQGLNILGIDTSSLAIFVSQRRGLQNAKVCSITQVNSKLGIFDTILLMGNNFGLTANLTRARWLLRRFFSITPPSGRIIAASSDPYFTDDKDHLAYYAWNKRRGRMAGQVRIRYRYRKYKDAWFDYLFVSKKEMENILVGTGWQVVEYVESKPPLYIAIIEKQA